MLPTSAHYRTLHSLRTFTTALSHCRQLASTTTTKDFSEIPGPFALPLAGNIHLYKLGIYNIFEYHKVLEQLYTTYGPVARQRIGTRTVVHVFNPDDVKTVHSVEGKIPEVPPLQETTQLYRKKRNFSLGLGNTNGEEWYRLRKAVQQMMLRPKEVYHYLPLVDSVAKALVEKIRNKLDENNVLDNLQDVVAKWSMESSAMVCFERRLGCLDTNESFAEQMIQANRDIFIIGGVLKFSLPLFKYFSTPKWNKFIAAEDFFYTNATKFASETIDEINELRKSGQLDESKYNFMSYLLSKQELSRKDVTIITLSLFADGLSTTSPSLVFNLYCLARNPEVQEKVREEIIKNIPAHGSLSLEAINNFQLLKAAVKETFRLYPIGTETSRITGNEIVLSNYRIPAGTHVDLNQFVHFRSPAYFPQPDKFQPERWVRESQMGKSNSQGMHPYLLIPFGHGTRMCAGRRFAEQDLYTSIARILQSFRVELADKDYIMDQQYQTLMVPKRPLSLRFVPRN